MYVVVFVTAGNKKKAKLIAQEVVKRRLAACVNIIEGVQSLFWWKGKADSGKEALLVIKSRKDKLQALIRAVKKAHSYEVPEIIALPLVGGYKPYLKWIDESVR